MDGRDGRYGRPVLDHQSGKTLKSFRRKPREEDGKNPQRDRSQLEVLPTEKNLATLAGPECGL